MKILYWSGLFWPHIGGVEVLSLQFIPAMQERGHEFIVLTSQSNPGLIRQEDHKGITIYRLPFQNGLAEHNLKEIKKIKQKVIDIKKVFKPDLIHINSIDASIFYHLITDNYAESIPTLFTVHSLPPYIINNNTVLQKMLNSAKWITTASEAMLAAIHKLIPINIPYSSLIYYGLIMPDLEPKPLPYNPPRFLCLGRLVTEKGFDIALDAFVDITNRFPESRLIITGDGPARAELEARSNKLGITDFVEFIGWVVPEKVPELINNSTAVIIPSRWEEPFGLVALQAAQTSRPVIAARVGGLPEIVEHQSTGLLFQKENSKALAEEIFFLLENQEKAIEMGQNARKKVMDRFGFDRFVNEYDDLYNKLIRTSGSTNKVNSNTLLIP